VLGRCYSVRQLAHHWRVAPARIRAMVRRGFIRAFLIGRSVRIPPEAVSEAERLLAVPVGSGNRRRPSDAGIDPEVLAFLNADD
jgi:hypothetical protein